MSPFQKSKSSFKAYFTRFPYRYSQILSEKAKKASHFKSDWHMTPKKGFSLVELLTVIGVLGVLASIAITSYGKYQMTAAKNTVQSDAKAIAKAFMTCTVTGEFNDCDDLTELGVESSNGTAKSQTPYFCAQFKVDVRGDTYKYCIHVNKDTDKIDTTDSTVGSEKGTCKSSGECE